MSSKTTLLNRYWTDIYHSLHYPHKEKLTHQMIRIMQLVEKQKQIGVNEIATHIQVSHNTASEHVKRLIEKQYVIKNKDLSDARKIVLALTEGGKEVLYRNTSLDEDKLEHILSMITNEEEQKIIDALKLLSEKAKQCM